MSNEFYLGKGKFQARVKLIGLSFCFSAEIEFVKDTKVKLKIERLMGGVAPQTAVYKTIAAILVCSHIIIIV